MTETAGAVADHPNEASTPAPAASLPYDNAPTMTIREDSTDLSEVEVLRIENERLKREIAAHVEHRLRTDEINARIKAAAMHVDNAKAEYLDARKGHKDALEELRAFTSGDVQVRADFSKQDDGKQAPGANAPKAPVTGLGNLRVVAASYGCWQHAMTRDLLEKLDVSGLRPLEPELKKRKVEAVEIVGAKYVPLEQVIFADGSGYFDAWPLVEPSEWDARLADTYAHAIRDLDEEAPDITAKRSAGGERNGITVKVGRKKYVVGPDVEVVRLVFLADGMKPGDECEATALLDATAKAAGAKVLSFPTKQLADRLVLRLAEYVPTDSGYHEGLVVSLAGDLGVEAAEIVAAAKSDSFRFDVYQRDAGGLGSQEIVRLLVNDAPTDVVTPDDEDDTADLDDADESASDLT